MGNILIPIILEVIQIYIWIVIANAVLSWFIGGIQNMTVRKDLLDNQCARRSCVSSYPPSIESHDSEFRIRYLASDFVHFSAYH